jgi:hypothetical protein
MISNSDRLPYIAQGAVAWIKLAKRCVNHPRKGKDIDGAESNACETLSKALKAIEVRGEEGVEGLSLYVTKYREYQPTVQAADGSGRSIFTTTATTGVKAEHFVDLGKAACAPDAREFFSSFALSRMIHWFSKGVNPCAPQWAASNKAGVSQSVITMSCYLQYPLLYPLLDS